MAKDKMVEDEVNINPLDIYLRHFYGANMD